MECQRNSVVMSVVFVCNLRKKTAANQSVARVLKVLLAHLRIRREPRKRYHLRFTKGFHSLGADFIQGRCLRMKPAWEGNRKENKQKKPKSPPHDAIVAKMKRSGRPPWRHNDRWSIGRRICRSRPWCCG